MWTRFFTVAILLLISGCACATPEPPAPASRESGASISREDNVMRFTGRVVYVPIEGGFFGIVADDGRKYDPRNLPEAFQRDGLPVQVTARPLEGIVGFHMWGQIVEIVEIKKR